MPEWPIYKCNQCGALLEQDSGNAIYETFGYVIVFALILLVGRLIGLWIFGDSDLAINITAWTMVGIWLYWKWTKPIRLGVRGKYALRK